MNLGCESFCMTVDWDFKMLVGVFKKTPKGAGVIVYQ